MIWLNYLLSGEPFTMSKKPIDEGRRTTLKAAAGLGTIGIAGYAGASHGIRSGPRDVNLSATDRLWFAGLEHTALGDATLDTSTGSLVVSNIDSGGDDGVSVAVGETEGHMVQLPVDPSTIPTGASMVSRFFGSVDGSTGQHLATMHRTRVSEGFDILPDFSNVGTDTYTLTLYNDGTKVFEGSGFSTETTVKQDTKTESEWCAIIPIYVYCKTVDDDEAVVVTPDGDEYVADRFEFSPDSLSVESMTLTGVEITAADIDQFQIDDETVRVFGRPHAALGDAHIHPENDGTQLTVDNIDGVGDDGVSARLDGVKSYTATLDPVTFDVTDASLKTSATGILSGTPDSSLGRSSLTNTGDQLQATTDFSAVGSDTTRVEVFDNGEKVGETTVPSGDVGVIESIIPIDICGKLPPNPPCFLWRGPYTATFTASDGTSFVGNDFRFLAADADETFEGLNSFDIRAANVDSFTQVDETTE